MGTLPHPWEVVPVNECSRCAKMSFVNQDRALVESALLEVNTEVLLESPVILMFSTSCLDEEYQAIRFH